jgi:hypothetical protein
MSGFWGKRRTWIGALVASALSATVLLGTASAASANDPNADGQDPYSYPNTTNSCSKNASIVGSAAVVDGGGRTLGTGYLWFSRCCGTNWAEVRASVAAGGSGSLETDVYRYSPYEIQPYTWYGNFPTGGHSWGNMIYAPTQCAGANVIITLASGDSGSVWINDPTC